MTQSEFSCAVTRECGGFSARSFFSLLCEVQFNDETDIVTVEVELLRAKPAGAISI